MKSDAITTSSQLDSLQTAYRWYFFLDVVPLLSNSRHLFLPDKVFYPHSSVVAHALHTLSLLHRVRLTLGPIEWSFNGCLTFCTGSAFKKGMIFSSSSFFSNHQIKTMLTRSKGADDHTKWWEEGDREGIGFSQPFYCRSRKEDLHSRIYDIFTFHDRLFIRNGDHWLPLLFTQKLRSSDFTECMVDHTSRYFAFFVKTRWLICRR